MTREEGMRVGSTSLEMAVLPTLVREEGEKDEG